MVDVRPAVVKVKLNSGYMPSHRKAEALPNQPSMVDRSLSPKSALSDLTKSGPHFYNFSETSSGSSTSSYHGVALEYWLNTSEDVSHHPSLTSQVAISATYYTIHRF